MSAPKGRGEVSNNENNRERVRDLAVSGHPLQCSFFKRREDILLSSSLTKD